MPTPPDHLVARTVRAALLEDLGAGDLTTAALAGADRRATARIVARQPAVVSGTRAARMAFRWLDPDARVSIHSPDGAPVAADQTILVVESTARGILAAERTALNFLARLSGIATLTRRCVGIVSGTRAAIYDTRKTTPGLRPLEREAVRAGGGTNHRQGLHDAILIKDNHAALVGDVVEAIRRTRGRYGEKHPIEVEIDHPDQLSAVLEAGASIVLLDNMSVDDLKVAVRMREARGSGHSESPVILEASGGITLEDLREVALTGVDRISLGLLTHSAPSIDLSLELDPIS